MIQRIYRFEAPKGFAECLHSGSSRIIAMHDLSLSAPRSAQLLSLGKDTTPQLTSTVLYSTGLLDKIMCVSHSSYSIVSFFGVFACQHCTEGDLACSALLARSLAE